MGSPGHTSSDEAAVAPGPRVSFLQSSCRPLGQVTVTVSCTLPSITGRCCIALSPSWMENLFAGLGRRCYPAQLAVVYCAHGWELPETSQASDQRGCRYCSGDGGPSPQWGVRAPSGWG